MNIIDIARKHGVTSEDLSEIRECVCYTSQYYPGDNPNEGKQIEFLDEIINLLGGVE